MDDEIVSGGATADAVGSDGPGCDRSGHRFVTVEASGIEDRSDRGRCPISPGSGMKFQKRIGRRSSRERLADPHTHPTHAHRAPADIDPAPTTVLVSAERARDDGLNGRARIRSTRIDTQGVLHPLRRKGNRCAGGLTKPSEDE
jgi:hypothetical protein